MPALWIHLIHGGGLGESVAWRASVRSPGSRCGERRRGGKKKEKERITASPPPSAERRMAADKAEVKRPGSNRLEEAAGLQETSQEITIIKRKPQKSNITYWPANRHEINLNSN